MLIPAKIIELAKTTKRIKIMRPVSQAHFSSLDNPCARQRNTKPWRATTISRGLARKRACLRISNIKNKHTKIMLSRTKNS